MNQDNRYHVGGSAAEIYQQIMVPRQFVPWARRLIESAASMREPHRIAFYLYDLASAFHAHWNRGTENPDLRFIKVNNPDLTCARLGLVQAVSDVLTSGLTLLGTDAPTEMR